MEARRAEPRLRFVLGHVSIVENTTNAMNGDRCDIRLFGKSSRNDSSVHDASRDIVKGHKGHEYSTRTGSWTVTCSSASLFAHNYHKSMSAAAEEALWPLVAANTIGTEEDDEDSEDYEDSEDDEHSTDDEDNEEDDEEDRNEDDEDEDENVDRDKKDEEDVNETCTQQVNAEIYGAGHNSAKQDSNVRSRTASTSDLADSPKVVDLPSPNCGSVPKPLYKGRPVQWRKRFLCWDHSGRFLVQQSPTPFRMLNRPTVEQAWWKMQGAPSLGPN